MTFFGPDIRNGLPIGLGSMAGFGRRAFTPSVLFAAGEQGFWYDPSDIPVNWRRNLLTRTEEFDNAAWTKTRINVSQDAAIAPNNALTADRLSEDNNSGTHIAFQAFGTAASTNDYTISAYFKNDGVRYVVLALYEGVTGTNIFAGQYDLQTGTITGYAKSAGVTPTGTITSVGNGWYYCTLTCTTTGGGASAQAQIWLNRAGTFTANPYSYTGYTGDGTSGIYVWGAQLERASTASTYQRIITPEISFLEYKPQPVMFQESTGVTPVWGVEQAVGLILDKIRGLVLGPELVTNGDFSGGTTGWGTFACSIAAVNGELVVTANAGAAFPQATQTVSGLTAGRSYLFTAIARRGTTVDSAYITAGAGINATTSSTTATALRLVFVATGATNAIGLGIFSGSTNGTAVFDNISVREIAGNHAIQPTSASRPTLRARYNQLLYSEDFSNAVWVKSQVAVTADQAIAPNGTQSADFLKENGANAVHVTYQGPAGAAGAATLTLYAKSAGRSFLRVGFSDTLDYAAIVNLTTAAVPTVQAGIACTAELLADSWVKITVSRTLGGAANVFIGPNDNGTNLGAYQGDNTSGVYLWGADLRRTIDTYLPYQRIAAATDYDLVGFPPYLAYDGVDDSLYTGGSIDFSATDRMTVWAGVTKLSDAALGFVTELSASISANNGAFWLMNGDGQVAAGPIWQFSSKGTVVAFATTGSVYASPITNVLTATGDIAADVANLRVDGVQVASSTADQGTGNYGSYPLYIGRRNNASLPFNGRVYALIGRGAATSAALIQQAERWVASKQGRTL